MEACCIGNSCFKDASFNALVDSGTSFTFLPQKVYEKVSQEVLSFANELKSYGFCIHYMSIPHNPAIYNSLTDGSMLIALAMMDLPGSIAMRQGEWHPHCIDPCIAFYFDVNLMHKLAS